MLHGLFSSFFGQALHILRALRHKSYIYDCKISYILRQVNNWSRSTFGCLMNFRKSASPWPHQSSPLLVATHPPRSSQPRLNVLPNLSEHSTPITSTAMISWYAMRWPLTDSQYSFKMGKTVLRTLFHIVHETTAVIAHEWNSRVVIIACTQCGRRAWMRRMIGAPRKLSIWVAFVVMKWRRSFHVVIADELPLATIQQHGDAPLDDVGNPIRITKLCKDWDWLDRDTIDVLMALFVANHFFEKVFHRRHKTQHWTSTATILPLPWFRRQISLKFLVICRSCCGLSAMAISLVCEASAAGASFHWHFYVWGCRAVTNSGAGLLLWWE